MQNEKNSQYGQLFILNSTYLFILRGKEQQIISNILRKTCFFLKVPPASRVERTRNIQSESSIIK